MTYAVSVCHAVYKTNFELLCSKCLPWYIQKQSADVPKTSRMVKLAQKKNSKDTNIKFFHVVNKHDGNINTYTNRYGKKAWHQNAWNLSSKSMAKCFGKKEKSKIKMKGQKKRMLISHTTYFC